MAPSSRRTTPPAALTSASSGFIGRRTITPRVQIRPVSSVCVIGAGSSGIAAVKALAQRGIAFECFEKSDRVGGNWVYENSNGMSSAYRSLHINTSRPKMQYSDFPMPAHYPDFPHHSQIAEYFDQYADQFGIKLHINFRTKIASAEPVPGGGWELTTDGAK